MVAADPTASLAIKDIYVTIGGEEYRMPGRPAADWLKMMLSGDYGLVMPAWLVEEDAVKVLARLADDEFPIKEVDDAVYDVISVAAGRPWWWAMQLVMYASSDVHHWSRINGRLVLAGVRADRISLAAWVDAVYAIHIERMEAGEEYDKFRAAIDTPPTADLLDEDEEAAAFLSMMS
jgi:hypothetical protein